MLQQQQQQPVIKPQLSKTNKRKFNNLIISEVDSHAEVNEEEDEQQQKQRSENCDKSPVKVKIYDYELPFKNNSEINLIDCEDETLTVTNDADDTNSSSNSNITTINNRRNNRELLSFTIPEETEDSNSAETNKEK